MAIHQRHPFSVAHYTCSGEERRCDLLLLCDRYYVVDPAKATPERVALWKTEARQQASVGTGTLRHVIKAVGIAAAEEVALQLLAEVDCPRFTQIGLGGVHPN